MSHYQATLIHGYVHDMDKIVGMVIECDAPSEQDAADILFTAANRGNEVPSGVQVIEPLDGMSMTVGDLALVFDTEHRTQAALWCDHIGWRADGAAPDGPFSGNRPSRIVKR